MTAAPFTATRARQEPAQTASPASRRAHVSTPGLLRTGLVVLTVGVIVFGLVVIRSATARRRAAHEVATTASTRLTDAADAYVELADADAAASTAFLQGQLQGQVEPVALRRRYDLDVTEASRHFTTLAGGGSPQAKAALQAVTQQLPVYTGLVDSARANNREAHPVGAAYLHSASTLMRSTILPATTTVYEDAARHLDSSDRAGMAATETTAAVIVGAFLLLLLIGAQLYLAVRTRRILNVGLVIATVLVLALGIWSVVAFQAERGALHRSQRGGSDPLQLLSTSRILTLRAVGDDDLELIERGAVDTYLPDFESVRTQLGGSGGLIPLARASLHGSDATRDMASLSTSYGKFLADHTTLEGDDKGGSYVDAVKVASGIEASDAARLDAGYEQSLRDAGTQLSHQSRQAQDALTGLAIGAAIFIVLAAACVVLGLRRRIEEYA